MFLDITADTARICTTGHQHIFPKIEYSLIIELFKLLFLFLKTRKLVFFAFKDILLLWNHIDNLASSSLTKIIRL